MFSKSDMKAKKVTMTLEQFKNLNYGKRGTKKRDALEAGYKNFKAEALRRDAQLEKDL